MPSVQERLIAYLPSADPGSPADAALQARLDIFLEDAVDQLDPTRFLSTSMYQQAVALLAAHNISLSDRGGSGASGPVTLERAGEVAIQYAQTGSIAGLRGLESTPYGIQLARLLRKQPGLHMFTTGFTESDI